MKKPAPCKGAGEIEVEVSKARPISSLPSEKNQAHRERQRRRTRFDEIEQRLREALRAERGETASYEPKPIPVTKVRRRWAS
jgi:hypothetical protein